MPPDVEAACVVCGCTEERACVGGCSWVMLRPPLCSACVAFGQKIAETIKRHPVTAIAFMLAKPETAPAKCRGCQKFLSAARVEQRIDWCSDCDPRGRARRRG